MLNCHYGADALSNIGLRSGCKQDFMRSGLAEAARSAAGQGRFQLCACFLPWLMLCARDGHVPGVRRSARLGG